MRPGSAPVLRDHASARKSLGVADWESRQSRFFDAADVDRSRRARKSRQNRLVSVAAKIFILVQIVHCSTARHRTSVAKRFPNEYLRNPSATNATFSQPKQLRSSKPTPFHQTTPERRLILCSISERELWMSAKCRLTGLVGSSTGPESRDREM